MARWRSVLAVASVLVTIPMMPSSSASAKPDKTAAIPAIALSAPTCDSQPAPVEPIADLPWPQRRYAPDRLGPLATGAGVTVAVIDSGVDDHHPQLRGRVANGADYLDNGRGTLDCVGHGTAVASIIAAEAREGIEFRGLAPRARILPVRVSEQQSVDGKESGRTVTAEQFALAIRWAVDQGSDVVNLSVVLYEDHPAVRSSIAYAVDHDVVVVAAVGNAHGKGDPVPYPAAYDGVLGVGAIGPDGTRAEFSQVGPYVDVVAPGSEVLAAVPGRGHEWHNGTSYAAPFASATAALVRDYRPDLAAREVIERIIATADPAAGGRHSNAYGAGVINPYRAVTDTGAVGGPPAATTPSATQSDPAVVARQGRRSQAREMSLWLAAFGGGVAGVAVLVAVVLPRGARRRWQPADPA